MRVIGAFGRWLSEAFLSCPCYGENRGPDVTITPAEVPEGAENAKKSFFDIIDERYGNVEKREKAVYLAKYWDEG